MELFKENFSQVNKEKTVEESRKEKQEILENIEKFAQEIGDEKLLEDIENALREEFHKTAEKFESIEKREKKLIERGLEPMYENLKEEPREELEEQAKELVWWIDEFTIIRNKKIKNNKDISYQEENKDLDIQINGRGKIYFSPDKKHIAFGYEIFKKQEGKKKYFFVIDRKKQTEYDYCQLNRIFFSSRNNRIAYIAVDEKRNLSDAPFFFVIDGKEEENNYTNLFDITFSPNENYYAYIGYLGEKTKKGGFTGEEINLGAEQEAVVLNGKEQKRYDDINSDIVFSPDLNNEHYTYIAIKGRKQFVVFDGQEQKQYDEIIIRGWSPFITFSPDGKKYTYIAYNDVKKKYFVVFNGQEQKQEYDEIIDNSIVFIPNENCFEYWIKEKNGDEKAIRIK
ncbi:MAG: hypothetical protein ABIJ84_00175 [bacterium]